MQNTTLLIAPSNVTEMLSLDEMWTAYLISAQEGQIAEIDYHGLLLSLSNGELARLTRSAWQRVGEQVVATHSAAAIGTAAGQAAIAAVGVIVNNNCSSGLIRATT